MSSKDTRSFLMLCLLPAMLVYLLVIILPTLAACAFSLTEWDGFLPPKWIGLDNYTRALNELSHDGIFRDTVLNTLFITFVPMIFVLVISLLFAFVIHRGIIGASFFRVVFFFPNVINLVAIALLWQLIYQPTPDGLANTFIASFGFHPVTWLAHEHMLAATIPIIVWASVGFFMILFLAAMQGIPESLYESAKLDGAHGLRVFWSITLPLIKDTIAISIVFMIIGGLKFFDMVWVLTSESPTRETHTMATLFYQKSFREYDIGYGTALSVILFLTVLIVSLVSLRLARRETVEF
jgi:raffinose/stachyose/melibiose transport system permease protein